MEEPMSRLAPDLLAEILSRVPYKSLCICKCVCPAWRDLIADPVYRNKIAQTLAGFFYKTFGDSVDPFGFSAVSRADLPAFPCASAPRTCPRIPLPLPLPPDSMDSMDFLQDSCDGLFLTRIQMGAPEPRTRYVVSSPATGEYALLPHSGYDGDGRGAYLGFDSSGAMATQEFHVFEFVREWPRHSWAAPAVVRRVQIYSSKTGLWLSTESKWDTEVTLCFGLPAVFHKGYMHVFVTQSGLAVVDTEGLTWRIIELPKLIDPSFSGCIGKSAGQLLYVNSDDCVVYGANLCSTVSVYVLSAEVYRWEEDVSDSHLNDDGCRHWELLHKLSNVYPEEMFQFGFDLRVIGVHPHANMIFIVDSDNQLVAYDLDRRESTVVCHIEHSYKPFRQFFPYVPFLSRLPLDGGVQLATSSN